jgi:chromate reductase
VYLVRQGARVLAQLAIGGVQFRLFLFQQALGGEARAPFLCQLVGKAHAHPPPCLTVTGHTIRHRREDGVKAAVPVSHRTARVQAIAVAKPAAPPQFVAQHNATEKDTKMAHPKLLMISGSLRKGSYNRMLLAQAAEAFGPAEVIEGDLDLPLYNGDLEEAEGVPEKVQHLVQQIKDADAIVVGSPEYNKGITGVLKNALDWISRVPGWPMKDKPTVVVSASAGRTGGETAQFMTLSCLTQHQARLLPGTAVLIAGAMNAFDEDGRLKDETSQKLLTERMEKLRAEVV